jgi:small-conductance mechanosensitive channel
VQFLLNEDIYPRAHLRRGLPYAISRTFHYAILVGGFLMAVAALGFDMTKFTILAGAFTVGVGFGLQNIFNNFVSGLILLFERPVQVGDIIQMDDATGVVDRIGIRASIVRTGSGSEIIVPNGKLISERVINWTLSNHRRSIEIPVAVSHGASPKLVIEVMNAAASAHPKVSRSPPPQTLLTRMGPEWLGFELRAWIEDIEDWIEVRSDISITVSEALANANIALK